MLRVDVQRVGRKWRVRSPAGKATVDTLGDAKRVGEALAQRILQWSRQSDSRWVGTPLPVEAKRGSLN